MSGWMLNAFTSSSYMVIVIHRMRSFSSVIKVSEWAFRSLYALAIVPAAILFIIYIVKCYYYVAVRDQEIMGLLAMMSGLLEVVEFLIHLAVTYTTNWRILKSIQRTLRDDQKLLLASMKRFYVISIGITVVLLTAYTVKTMLGEVEVPILFVLSLGNMGLALHFLVEGLFQQKVGMFIGGGKGVSSEVKSSVI